jgi:hypothetical protein
MPGRSCAWGWTELQQKDAEYGRNVAFSGAFQGLCLRFYRENFV